MWLLFTVLALFEQTTDRPPRLTGHSRGSTAQLLTFPRCSRSQRSTAPAYQLRRPTTTTSRPAQPPQPQRTRPPPFPHHRRPGAAEHRHHTIGTPDFLTGLSGTDRHRPARARPFLIAYRYRRHPPGAHRTAPATASTWRPDSLTTLLWSVADDPGPAHAVRAGDRVVLVWPPLARWRTLVAASRTGSALSSRRRGHRAHVPRPELRGEIRGSGGPPSSWCWCLHLSQRKTERSAVPQVLPEPGEQFVADGTP